MLAGARDREKRQWEHTMAVCTMLGNVHGSFGRHSKPLDYLYRKIFGYDISREQVTKWKDKIAELRKTVPLTRKLHANGS